MKNKLILFTLVLSLILSMVTVSNSGKASAATLPVYDYMILGNAVYESTSTSTLASELAKAQKSKKPKASETFSDKTEKRMVGSWIKYHHKYNKSTGFQANAYYNPSRKEIVIAFAGTNDDSDWLDTDGTLGITDVGTILVGKSHKQKKDAQDYVTLIANSIGKSTYGDAKAKKKPTVSSSAKIMLVGHSLGGYLVQTAGLYLIDNPNLSGKFKSGITFNALGLSGLYGRGDMTPSQYNYRKSSKYNKFSHLWVTNEFLHAFNNHRSQNRVLAGSSIGLRPIKIGAKFSTPTTQFRNHSYKALYHYANFE